MKAGSGGSESEGRGVAWNGVVEKVEGWVEVTLAWADCGVGYADKSGS